MFFRFYDKPGLRLPVAAQAGLRKELLEIAQVSLDPVPDYQCLSSRPDALDDKVIVVAYTGTEDDAKRKQEISRAVAFASALYLDVPGVEHAVLHTGLTVALPSVHRTGILVQLYAQLFQNTIPRHPQGMWVTTTSAHLTILVQSEKALYNTYPRPPDALAKQRPPKPSQQHLDIARAIDERYRAKLLISPQAEFDEEMFVFRGSLDWPGDEAACFKKELDDVRFWHRNANANQYFRALMRPGKGDEVLLIGFMDAERLRNAVEEMRSRL